MPARDPRTREISAQIGGLSRSRTDDDPDLVAAREALRLARLREAVRRAVAAAPPMTPEFKADLAELILLAPASFKEAA